MDHVTIEIGLGRFEAFAIIGARHDSSVQESVAGALGWLSGRFIASVMSTDVEVRNCTAANGPCDSTHTMRPAKVAAAIPCRPPFVLPDMFAVPSDEIAPIMGRSPTVPGARVAS